MRRMRTLVTYANVMSTLALFVALGGGAYAATTFTGANGVVKLCVSGRGAVQVLKATKTRCGKGSMLVPVNQQGRTGSPGTAGAPGPTGAQGPAGAQGPSGAQGPAGTAAPAYTAGAGLTLTGTAFSADLTQLQSRITGSGCAADQALQSVSQAGTPTCTGLHAYSSTSGVATDYSNETSTVIPAGHWLLIGQALAEASPNGDTGVVCQLQLNSKSVDTVEDTLPANGEYTESPIATVTTTAASNVAQIICNAASPMTAIGANLTIAAIPLTALN